MIESLESKEKSTKEELNGLEKNIRKDLERFCILSNDKDVQNSINKVFNKCSNEVFAEERKQFEKVNVSKTLDNILNKHPDLRFYITGTLGLPLGTTKFSSLTNEQKMNFCTLCNSINQKNFLQPKNLVNRCNLALNDAQKKLNKNFKRKNISNRWMLEKTLPEDFGLTKDETQKFKEYLLLIKKHPEYIGNLQLQEAGIGKFGIGVIVGIITTILAGLGIQHIVNMGKPNPETVQTLGKTEINDPKSIAKLLTQSSHFEISGSQETSLYKENENDGILKALGKEFVNTFESKTISMTTEGELVLMYDLEGSTLTVDHDSGEVTLKIKNPDITTMNTSSKITKKNGEWFELKYFDNDELILEEKLKQQAINDAKADPNFYEKAKLQTETDLFNTFKELQIYGVDVKSVKVEYIDDINMNNTKD